MRRRQEEDSSLELLLDTMCNTFGGVMFIAISLAVMLSMRGAVKSISTDESKAIEAAQQKIVELQQKIDQYEKEQKTAGELIRQTSADPRMQLVREIVFLEQTLETRKIQQKLAEQKRTLARTQLLDIQNKNQKITAALQKEEERETNLLRRKQELEKAMAKYSGGKNNAFSTLSRKELPPYFILMNDGKVWSIGPDISESSYEPAPAVTYEARDGRYICRPKPGKGIAVFKDGALSAELLSCLRSVPQDRVPEFVISPGDAAVFALLREKLKALKLFHGFRLQKQNQDEFDYQFSNDEKGSYEY